MHSGEVPDDRGSGFCLRASSVVVRVVSMFVLLAVRAGPAFSAEVVPIGQEAQVFVDDYVIESLQEVTRLCGMSVFPDRGTYFGLLRVYHPNQLMIDVQLAFSRDGTPFSPAACRTSSTRTS